MNTGNGQTLATINMTPMIDVLLVMLIIFMAIAPLSPSGLAAAIPRNSTTTAEPMRENPVLLEIADNGSYRLNSEPVPLALLQPRLVAAFAARGNRTLFVKAAGGLEFQTVAAAFDTARAANIDRVAITPR